MITSAKYDEHGNIVAIIDDVEMFVPNDINNRHRADIAEWEAEGNTIAPYSPPPVDLAAYAAQKRWEVETGGITVGGIVIATDDRSKLMIMGSRTKAKEDPNHTKRWKSPDGFVTLDALTIIAIADAVAAHVQACFDKEDEVLAAIEAGTITTIAGVDDAGWPA